MAPFQHTIFKSQTILLLAPCLVFSKTNNNKYVSTEDLFHLFSQPLHIFVYVREFTASHIEV